MTTANLATVATESTLATIGPELSRAADYARSAKADNTRRAYAADWRAFAAWCETRGVTALPADSRTVAAYLAGLADQGRKVATLERALAAVIFVHRARGCEWQKGQAAIREVMSGIRRSLGVAPSKKSPVTDVELRAMVATCDASPAGLRDRALLLLGFFGAFRRSELVALTLADVSKVREGLLVTVRRSKTDQEGEGQLKAIPFASDPALCPVRALGDWTATLGDAPDTMLFDLSDKAVSRIVKARAKAAGLDPSLFGGHSLRAGFATTAAKAGRDLGSIMRQTGHRSERVARGYVRLATAFAGNAAVGLL